jgi:hypothetical protein
MTTLATISNPISAIDDFAIAIDIEKQQITEKTTIRAAAFARLLKFIVFVKKNPNVFDEFLVNGSSLAISQEEKEENTHLNTIIRQMIDQQGNVSAVYPDVEPIILAKVFAKVLRFYSSDTEIYSKINMCWVMQLGVTAIFKMGHSDGNNLRATEQKDMNTWFHDTSRKIAPTDYIDVSAEFITVYNHSFHPDSHFVEFSVRF